MKTVKDTLLDRRTIRRYERDEVTPEQMDFIYDAICNTPTSYNGQQFSVIDITSQDIKLKLEALTGQKQIKTCNHFLMFCADFHKIRIAAEAKGIDWPDFPRTVDGVTVGIIDASLAMMSAIVAAESLGLATCPIGYARTAAPSEISDILNLPQDVVAVCGLAIGVPRELPDIKPKLPRQSVVFGDTYRTDDMVPELLDYDRQIAEYTAHRSGAAKVHPWVDNIVGYYREAMSYQMKKAFEERGYGFEK